mmetsp:Transcript_9540/g.20131  ORF Transcript_9540/g.20131 Transcript_9540/m.20131 type:complete len:231 (-) Transcript_9540:661-1353(-)
MTQIYILSRPIRSCTSRFRSRTKTRFTYYETRRVTVRYLDLSSSGIRIQSHTRSIRRIANSRSPLVRTKGAHVAFFATREQHTLPPPLSLRTRIFLLSHTRAYIIIIIIFIIISIVNALVFRNIVIDSIVLRDIVLVHLVSATRSTFLLGAVQILLGLVFSFAPLLLLLGVIHFAVCFQTFIGSPRLCRSINIGILQLIVWNGGWGMTLGTCHSRHFFIGRYRTHGIGSA